MPLTSDELAYMRETQAEDRPTAANLVPRNETPDGMGGTDTEAGDPIPIQVRIATNERRVPDAILAQNEGATVVTITMDLVAVQAGDQITVSGTEAYEVVSDGDLAAWTTAQQVYAVRRVWP